MEKKKLMRELRQEALLRMELAARTEPEYWEITKMWNKLDANREWHERYYEIYRKSNDIMKLFDPRSEMMDRIFLNPDEFHFHIEDEDIYRLVEKLPIGQREVLYWSAVQMLAPQYIAWAKGQTDRNVRKKCQRMIVRLQKKLVVCFGARACAGKPLTDATRRFMERYAMKGGAKV